MRADDPLFDREMPSGMGWGSDAIAAMLRELKLPYIALNPGASYRGLHDSIVNFLGNVDPSIVLCLHEEHAVAIAHGYAKVAERPMTVALHSNVGLMHATMALFNAFCDRVPMMVVGATGPLDAAQRRPWIDWIHTSADQGQLIRHYVKWDDQPGSVAAALEAIARGSMLTSTEPKAPVYVCLDAELQETALAAPVAIPDPARHQPPAPAAPGEAGVHRISELLATAQRPLLLLGRVSRGRGDWELRVKVAEHYGVAVLTDLKTAAAFPSRHALNPAAPGTFLTPEGTELIRAADLIVSLDWIDLGGTLSQAYGDRPVPAHIVSCTLDHTLHNGWTKDHFALAPVDLAIQSSPDELVRALARRCDERPPARHADWPPARILGSSGGGDGATVSQSGTSSDQIRLSDLARALQRSLGDRPRCMVRLPLGWSGRDLDVADPLDYLGQDGGAGIGSGPGITVGAALALSEHRRRAVSVLGDGDFLMGASALWTAARLGLPMLIVVANNRSFFNDEMHQERVARARGRPVENRWIGQRIDDPAPDLAALARSLGLEAEGPVVERSMLAGTLDRAVAAAYAGSAVVVDVHVGVQAYATGGSPPRRATPAPHPPEIAPAMGPVRDG